ncbi:DUF2947 domain-containing protein [Parendozoicomonas haliclonae]|uniref:DUF2947 domain-containing protein n=1 Tax=Parendozoicomonas haliclonae TaxID=1960125 RepID=A0A1X7ADM2_9GAMM|nr:DUF2947 domain-containing protein [Parendozoicomonas haliclonae]SMA32151.1 hypothetical protein EHSB41UT_00111 [Parendozoicomonas haliclonae]
MKYIPLSEYKHAWVFRHAELTVPAEDLEQIKPLTPTAANDLWRNNISKQGKNPDDLADDDWPMLPLSWDAKGHWQERWESDDAQMPEEIVEELNFNIGWTPETTVYYCIDSDAVIETRWDIFCRHWKNFLFFDDNTILIGRKRKQAVQFHQDGTFDIGVKGTVPSASE